VGGRSDLRLLSSPTGPSGGTGRFEDEILDLGGITDRIACTIHPHYIDPEHIRFRQKKYPKLLI